MTEDLIDAIQSLTALMEEESDKLLSRGRALDLPVITAAKTRLVAAIETITTQLERERPGWMATLGEDDRAQLAAAVRYLLDASAVNADVLRRQIELSSEMMATVAAEVQRLMGTSSATYSAHGHLFQVDQAAPISLNTQM